RRLLSGPHYGGHAPLWRARLSTPPASSVPALSSSAAPAPSAVYPLSLHDALPISGLVERRRDPEDARLSRVYLTPRGRALEQPLRTLWSRREEHLVADMTTEERLLVRRLLLQMHANIS